jgi:hypothetical protein
LLYGLQGQPLPPAAVKLAAKVDDQMRDGLLSVRACRDAGDANALVALTETNDMAWTGSPMLPCAAVEGLIAMKKIPEAMKVLDRVEEAFRKALRPKQLRGLALARSGDATKAQLVLGRLYAAGEIDPETLGILAGTWMDRYNQTNDKIFLLKSRDLYRLRGTSVGLLHRDQCGFEELVGRREGDRVAVRKARSGYRGRQSDSRRLLEDGDRR